MGEDAVKLRELLSAICAKCGMPVAADRIEQMVALVDGAVLNAIIEIHADPRARARRMLKTAFTA
jgi:hypothetical protein